MCVKPVAGDRLRSGRSGSQSLNTYHSALCRYKTNRHYPLSWRCSASPRLPGRSSVANKRETLAPVTGHTLLLALGFERKAHEFVCRIDGGMIAQYHPDSSLGIRTREPQRL